MSSGSFDAIHIGGLSLIKSGRYDEGFTWLAASLRLVPSSADWYVNAGRALLDEQQNEMALDIIQDASWRFPTDVRVAQLYAMSCARCGNLEDAVELTGYILKANPEFYQARVTRGFALHMLGRFDESLACYDAVMQTPYYEDYELLANNRAAVYIDCGQPQRAYEILSPYASSSKPITLYNLALLHLGFGRWEQGWALNRHRAVVKVPDHMRRPTQMSDFDGKHPLLFHEQGFGDSIQFLRYAAVVAPHVSGLTMGLPQPLIRLAQTMRLGRPFTVVAPDEHVSADCAVPLMDIAELSGTTVVTTPAEVPYFHVPPQEIERRALGPKLAGQMRVGLVWAGDTRQHDVRSHAIDRRRSMPFELLEPLLSMSGRDVAFYSLQLADHHRDDGRVIRALHDDYDFLDTAAVISQLDLVITIDSSVCHLAGAIAKPVWMMSRIDSCWRWLWDGSSRTPWYPTMTIYRQPSSGDWQSVVERITGDLRRCLAGYAALSPVNAPATDGETLC